MAATSSWEVLKKAFKQFVVEWFTGGSVSRDTGGAPIVLYIREKPGMSGVLIIGVGFTGGTPADPGNQDAIVARRVETRVVNPDGTESAQTTNVPVGDAPLHEFEVPENAKVNISAAYVDADGKVGEAKSFPEFVAKDETGPMAFGEDATITVREKPAE